MSNSEQESTEPTFWRDDALPFVEARSIRDGRKVCYARHSHETFSIGAVTSGHCIYLNRKQRERIGSGSVVIMNPGDVHACNPYGDDRWSYHMLYVDVSWLSEVQRDLGVGRHDRFRAFATTASAHRELYLGLRRLYAVLTDRQAETLHKHAAALTFMSEMHQALGLTNSLPERGHRGLTSAAEFIRDNYARSLKLDEICAAADLSPSHLIRAFKEKYGLTPHAYLTNCRIEFSRAQLRRGRPIAEVALAAGFSDQAHLQRSFKKLVAATPGQYRS